MERVLLGALVDQGMRVWSARLRMLGRSMEHGFKKYLVAELELRLFFSAGNGCSLLEQSWPSHLFFFSPIPKSEEAILLLLLLGLQGAGQRFLKGGSREDCSTTV